MQKVCLITSLKYSTALVFRSYSVPEAAKPDAQSGEGMTVVLKWTKLFPFRSGGHSKLGRNEPHPLLVFYK